MTTTRITFRHAGILCILVNGMIWLTACAPLSLAASGEALPSKAAIAQADPTSAPAPTTPDGMPNGVVTLMPDEKVVVSNVSQLSSEASPPSRYSIESQPITGKPTHWRALYLVDSSNGNKVRLGNDSGTAIYGAMSDEYFLWFFLCDLCQDVKSGLHAYSLRTGKDAWIADNVSSSLGSVKIAGDWVTYISITGEYTADLYAHNLATNEIDFVAKDVLRYSMNGIFSEVNEAKIAWVAIDLNAQKASLKVYDLATHTVQNLETPTQSLSLARDLSVSNQIVVWRNETWWGYDLTQDALFTIPVVPPGWENVPVEKVGPVTVKANQLYWSLEVNGQTHSFTALVVPQGKGGLPADTIPTPHRKPTLSPIASTPTPVPLPTAYP
jgi:hypothetical protein